ncbi:MAG: D-2-hydroxyacid dehydrogenase [Spirochaetes bacterium]|nr:D-2-hydroxyacid dehydrogenase [Spirochaetota bacterium]
MKIVVVDGYTLNPGDLSWSGFEELGDLDIYDRTESENEKIIGRIHDANAVLVNKTPINAQAIAACPDLKYIGVTATGYNVVDIQAARDRGITVTNVPVYGTAAVSQFTIAMLLELCARIGLHNHAVHAGRWQNCPDFCFWVHQLVELEGKTLGLIGFGRIGQSVAVIAKAMGMKIIYHDEKPATGGLGEAVSLDRLFAESDVITLHCPLLPQTKGIINKANIEKMKDGVMIINTSRGALIVEEDLAQALNTDKVRGAGVDVVSVEPIRGDNPLLKSKNCIITPHIAWTAKESRQRLMDMAVENLKAFLEGKPINVVN